MFLWRCQLKVSCRRVFVPRCLLEKRTEGIEPPTFQFAFFHKLIRRVEGVSNLVGRGQLRPTHKPQYPLGLKTLPLSYARVVTSTTSNL